jgi:hypothetical protein
LELPSNTTFAGTLSGNVATVNLGEPEFWSLNFAAPSGQKLVPTTYQNAQRYPFEPPGVPGLSVDGNGAGCNTLSGSFVIHQVTANKSGALSNFSADFIQHCEGAAPALFGSVRINSVLDQLSITNAEIKNGYAEFTITINPVRQKAAFALFSTVDGTAVHGRDYVPVSSAVKIPAGQGHSTVRVPLIGSHPGLFFYGSIKALDLPIAWVSSGSARL